MRDVGSGKLGVGKLGVGSWKLEVYRQPRTENRQPTERCGKWEAGSWKLEVYRELTTENRELTTENKFQC